MNDIYIKLLPCVYEVVGQPEKWTGVLESLTESFGLFGCNIFCIDELEQQLNTSYLSQSVQAAFPRYVELGIAELEMGMFKALYQSSAEQSLVYEDSILPIALNNKFVTQQEIDKINRWKAQDIKISNRAASILNKQPGRLDTLNFLFKKEKTEFDIKGSESIKKLLPHFAKVMELNRPFTLLKQRFDAVFEVLDKFKLAVFIMDKDRNIVVKNLCADRLIENHSIFKITRNGCLSINDRELNSSIGYYLSIDLLAHQVNNGVSRYCYPRLGNEQQYYMELSPLNAKVLDNRSLYLFIVVDTQHKEVIDLSGINKIYEFTASESFIARFIVDGFTNNEIAELRGTSLETVKTQVKSIFSKTGVLKRSDLINLAHRTSIPIDKV